MWHELVGRAVESVVRYVAFRYGMSGIGCKEIDNLPEHRLTFSRPTAFYPMYRPRLARGPSVAFCPGWVEPAASQVGQ